MKAHVAAYAALFVVASFGLLYNLGDRLLWADEAETALLAVNITKFGLPIADDGKNDLERTRPGSRNEQNLWIWTPWLDEYIAAASFSLFGRSTWAAKLPFALLALLSVGLLSCLAWKVSQDHEVALIAGLLYATCVPFLLHARQCRYYAVLMLAQVWLLYGAHRSLVQPSLRSAAHISLALAAIFYCNYIAVPGNVLGLGFAALLLARRHPRFVPLLLASGAGFALLAAPWLFYARPTGQAALLGTGNFVAYLVYYVGEIHYHVSSLALLALPVLMLAFERWRPSRVSDAARRSWDRQESRDLRSVAVAIIGFQLLVLAFAPDRFFRYLTPLIPVVILLAAFILVRFVPLRSLRLVLVGLMISSNLLATSVFLPFPKEHVAALGYPRFLQSITSDYEDRLEAVLAYLNRRSDPDQSVYVDDHELPLIFYTQMRVLDPRRAGRIFTKAGQEQPDWVFPAGPSALLDRKEMRFRPGPQYEQVTLEVPRSPRGGSRPHPDAHAFLTAEETQPFVLYRKQGGKSSSPGESGVR